MMCLIAKRKNRGQWEELNGTDDARRLCQNEDDDTKLLSQNEDDDTKLLRQNEDDDTKLMRQYIRYNP